MPKTIRCKNCSCCAIFYRCGFTSKKKRKCTKFNIDNITDNDGCTFGELGENTYISNPYEYDIDLSDQCAVNGPHDYIELRRFS